MGMQRLGIMAAVLVALGACSSPAPPPAAATGRLLQAGPCGGLDAAQAATILHRAPGALSGPRHLASFTCVYRARDDFYTSLTFNVYVEPSAAQAARKLAAVKDGLAGLSPLRAVGRLGDEAWRAPDPRVRRLLMRKGNVWLDVVTPGDEASQVAVARIVLAHLK